MQKQFDLNLTDGDWTKPYTSELKFDGPMMDWT